MPSSDVHPAATISVRPPNVWTLPPFALTSISHDPSHRILFRHPAYPSTRDDNILLILQAYDHPGGGLHHETARVACAIVAGNAWDGYFAYSAGGEPVGLGPDEVLGAGREYYFHVPYPKGDLEAGEGGGRGGQGDDDNGAVSATSSPLQPTPIPLAYKYPVCPTFQHWVFPHNNLPPSWLEPSPPPPPSTSNLPFAVPQAPSSLGSAVLLRDGSCRMSNHRDGVQCAHICPREEDSWFLSNTMERYNLSRFLPRDSLIDDLYNAIALRSDLHSAFDRRIFAFVPKPIAPPFDSSSSNTNTRFVTHVLQQTSEIGPLYHNASILPIRGVPTEFLFARFAWAIFPLLMPFLTSGGERLLLMVQDGSSVAKVVSAEECYMLAGNQKSASRSRSVSPKKRKAGDTPRESDSGFCDGAGEDIPPHKRCRQLSSPRRRILSLRSATPPSAPTDTQEETAHIHTILDNGITREVSISHDDLSEHTEEYPGHRRIERLKEKELERQRPDGWTRTKESVRGSVAWMVEMGADILEDPRAERWDEDDKVGLVDEELEMDGGLGPGVIRRKHVYYNGLEPKIP